MPFSPLRVTLQSNVVFILFGLVVSVDGFFNANNVLFASI